MGPNPLFSVIIPWHGRMPDLLRAVASLDAQVFKAFETIVVCNGPGLVRMAELVARPEFARCRFVMGGKADVSQARNAGIDAARGHWIAFLDADDRFLPHKLDMLANEIAKGDADLIFSRGFRVRSEILRPIYPRQFLKQGEEPAAFFFARGANLSASSIAVHRVLARDVRFSEGLKHYEDPDFVIRAAAAGGRVKMLAEPLYEWFDDRAEGRLSQGQDYAGMRAWAEANRAIWGSRAYAGFLARRIAQHELKSHPVRAFGELVNGWHKGGISLAELTQFLVRGFAPRRMVKRLVDLKSAHDAARI